ncbi:MAG: hypothetical protein E6Z15_06040, partial [Paenibacillus macerans]|nr:hypothetical protein [Paenibacillus macerans]
SEYAKNESVNLLKPYQWIWLFFLKINISVNFEVAASFYHKKNAAKRGYTSCGSAPWGVFP